MGEVLIVGIGRPRFGDDAVGLLAAEALRERLGGRARVVADAGACLALLHEQTPPELLVVVDAAEATAGFAPGCWRRVNYPAEAGVLGECALRDTHTLGVADALRLAGVLGALTGQTWIYCLAAERFVPETELSPAVSASLPGMLEQIEDDVRGWLRGRETDEVVPLGN